MKPEDQLLFAFCRQTLDSERKRQIYELCNAFHIDWSLVFAQAREHRISPLLAYHVSSLDASRLGLPPSVLSKFKLAQYSSVLFHEKRNMFLLEAVQYLRKRSIEAMLIKGAALEHLVYRKPWFTVSDDLDLLLRVHRSEVSPTLHHEFESHFFGTGIEFDYFEHHDVTLNGVLPVDFARIWRDAEPLDLEGNTVFLMTPEDMLLSLCINSCRKRYFRLKSLFDIAETIAAYPDLRWDLVVSRAQAYQCTNIVYSSLVTTQMTVGCRLPHGLLTSLPLSPVKKKLIRSAVLALLRFASLSLLTPSDRVSIAGRYTGLSLVLPYITYAPKQAWAKINEAVHAQDH